MTFISDTGTQRQQITMSKSSRKWLMAASIVPLWAGIILSLGGTGVVAIIMLLTTTSWNLPRITSALLFLGGSVVAFGVAFAISYLTKLSISKVAASNIDRYLIDNGVHSSIRAGVKRQIRRKFWFDSITHTVPTPYRRIIVAGKAKGTQPFCVMDVGSDFKSVVFEMYAPGETPTPPLTKTNNPMDGYKYFYEWQEEKRNRKLCKRG